MPRNPDPCFLFQGIKSLDELMLPPSDEGGGMTIDELLGEIEKVLRAEA